MPSTHSSLVFHIVFSTKNRERWFSPDFRQRLHAYLGGMIRNASGTPYAVGGTDDHIHLLVGLKPADSIPDLIRALKAESSKWIKAELGRTAFAWQEGYGVFSVSASALEKVREYVLGQEEHHRTRTFKEEYVAMLEKCGVEYDDRHLW
ncbi:IS200/IS605 family transposase [Akkermansiaceae bacterium]|nr:IS200/IS605 family transposase [Akkermansiaceae bacterium]